MHIPIGHVQRHPVSCLRYDTAKAISATEIHRESQIIHNTQNRYDFVLP